MSTIYSATGPVDTAELGSTLIHEHIVTLSPGVYSDPVPLSALTTACNTVTLGAGVYFLNFPIVTTPWSISKTVTAACDATGQGAQLVFANQSKLSLTGILNIPCGRKATAKGPPF